MNTEIFCQILNALEWLIYTLSHLLRKLFISYIYESKFQKILIHLAKDLAMFYLQILFGVLNLKGTCRFHLDLKFFYFQRSLSYLVVLK